MGKELVVILLAVVYIISFVNAQYGGNTGDGQSREWVISIRSISNFPALQILANDTVKWVNNDRDNLHTTTSTNNDEVWDSGVLYYTNSFSFTFDIPGTYTYQDSLHPAYMKGVIEVITPQELYEEEILESSVHVSTIYNTAPMVDGLFSSLQLASSNGGGSHITLFNFPPGQPPASSRGLPSSYAIGTAGQVTYIGSSDAFSLSPQVVMMVIMMIITMFF